MLAPPKDVGRINQLRSPKDAQIGRKLNFPRREELMTQLEAAGGGQNLLQIRLISEDLGPKFLSGCGRFARNWRSSRSSDVGIGRCSIPLDLHWFS